MLTVHGRAGGSSGKSTLKIASFPSFLNPIRLLVGLFFICYCLTTPKIDVFAKSGSTDLNVEVLPMLSLALSTDNINLHMVPYTNDAFTYDTMDLIVNTNNRTGYSLIMSLTSDENSLVQSGVGTKITNLSKNVSVTDSDKSNFTINSWGYTTTNRIGLGATTTFSPIPEFGDPETVGSSEVPVSNAQTSVTFAAHSDASITSGVYTNTIMFTAISNYVSTIDDFFHITYLQEMTPEICATATVPSRYASSLDYDGSHAGNQEFVPTVTLFDNRDNANYTVSRLADGNCWMTQNLRLATSAARKLNSSNSDLPEGTEFELPAAQREAGIAWAQGDSDIASINSNRAHHIAYDAGNLYNWYAATAGTGGYMTSSSDATASICPRGWRLPNVSDSKSYANYINDVLGYANGANNTAGSLLRTTPFSAVNTGYYHYSGEIRDQSSVYFVTRSPIDNIKIYTAQILPNGTETRTEGYKVNGYSVRCVAK